MASEANKFSENNDIVRAESVLRHIVNGTSTEKGASFFSELVKAIAEALGVSYVYLTEIANEERSRLRVLASWENGDHGNIFEYDISKTPCEHVMEYGICSFTENVAQYFPEDDDLVTMAAQCYVGAPLKGANDVPLGHLCVLDKKKLHEEPLFRSILTIFANRASSELSSERARKALIDRENTLIKHNEALAEIAKKQAQYRSSLDQSLHAVLKILVKTLEITAAGVWLLENQSFDLLVHTDLESVQQRTFQSSDIPNAQDILSTHKPMHLALEADHHRTFFPQSCNLLLVPLQMYEGLSGFLILEGCNTWNQEERHFATSVAEFVVTAMYNHKYEANLQERIRIEQAQKVLMDTAYQAGMSEIATGIIHNIGNVANSLQIACEQLRSASIADEVKSLRKVNKLINAHGLENLGEYLMNSDRGKQIVDFYSALADALNDKEQLMEEETSNLLELLALIRKTVHVQESYSKGEELSREVNLNEFIDTVLELHAATWDMLTIKVEVVHGEIPLIMAGQQKLAHVLLSLIRNAVEALEDVHDREKCLKIETGTNDEGKPWVSITDSGNGIPEEQQQNIFQYGFTTKPNGNGFGLHLAANALTEMGGRLSVSNIPGTGACFIAQFEKIAENAK